MTIKTPNTTRARSLKARRDALLRAITSDELQKILVDAMGERRHFIDATDLRLSMLENWNEFGPHVLDWCKDTIEGDDAAT